MEPWQGWKGGHGEQQNTVKNSKKGGGLAAPEPTRLR